MRIKKQSVVSHMGLRLPITVRTLELTLALIITAVMTGGCLADNTPSRTGKSDRLPDDAAIIRDLTSTSPTTTEQNEDLLELKHWKYGARPPAAGSGEGGSSQRLPDGASLSIQFLSVEEMEQIIEQLIAAGYLEEKPADFVALQAAVRKFQQDNGLQASGQLDSATLVKLKEAAGL